ncbi:MAG: Abi family protein [Saprospiraceae bacterium]|nr:Abi family protein [Saprospiraceae bacterium]MCB0574973.1 Abi family protein [Saprospiraceae bacterium]MCB9356763.1 Abi family protein [Lewinellaceae bacterium]
MRYSKPALQIPEQIRLLQSRGLLIDDFVKAESYLSHISYYRLRAYTYPFQDNTDSSHPFHPGVTFDDVLNVYRFDRKLRILVFDAIERIEIALRTQIIYHCSLVHGSHFYQRGALYRNRQNFIKDLKTADKEAKRSTEVFIKHYKSKYSHPKRPPAWMVLEILPFGTLSKLFENLRISPEKKTIAAHFGLNIFVLESWMHTLNHVRNICAHHSRLWNRTLTQIPKLPKNPSFTWVRHAIIFPDRIYATLCCIQYLLNTVSPSHTFHIRLKGLLQEYANTDLVSMGFPPDWDTEPFWK